AEPLEMEVVVRGVEAEEVGGDHGGGQAARLHDEDLRRPCIVLRQLPGIGLEQRLGLRELLRHGGSAGKMLLRERLLLELRQAVEANDRTDDDVADLEFPADAAGRARSD